MPGVRRIAVLRANALGDYLMSLPALHALCDAYPGAEITLVGAPWHARTLPGRPGPVDEVLVLPRVPELAGLQSDAPPADELPAFLDAVRERSVDVAVQLHGGGRASNPLVRAFGARLTAGLRAPDAEPLDRWVAYRYYQAEAARALEVVGLVGAVPPAEPPRFSVTDADREQALVLLSSLSSGARHGTVTGHKGANLRRYGSLTRTPDRAVAERVVALHPGATDERRRWPPERFAELGDALADQGCTVILTGVGAEAALVHQVIVGMRAPAHALVGALDIGGLAALYAYCALVVSNDTGPLHLAQAVGTPTIGLFWCGNAINAAASTRGRHRVLLSWTLHCPECGADCTRDLYPHRPGEGCEHSCSFLTDIPVAEAVEEAVDLLHS